MIDFVQRHTPPAFRPRLSSFLVQPPGHQLTHPRREERKKREPGHLQASGNLLFYFGNTADSGGERSGGARQRNDDGRNSPRQRFRRGLVREQRSSRGFADLEQAMDGVGCIKRGSGGRRGGEGGGGLEKVIWVFVCVLARTIDTIMISACLCVTAGYMRAIVSTFCWALYETGRNRTRVSQPNTRARLHR